MACYSGPNPVTDEERFHIWRWAKANGIDQGMPYEKVGDAINEHFFGGQARPEWISDILSGRKTPFKHLANDVWRKRYNRRLIEQQAREISKTAALGPVAKMLRTISAVPRTAETIGHFTVFPISHGGDLILRPLSWDIFARGFLRTYRGAFSKVYAAKELDRIQRSTIYDRPLFDTSLRSGLDVGPRSHATGILSKFGGGMSDRAWQMLTVMRYELWERAMKKFIRPDMSEQEVLEIGKHLADWANNATGSGKGLVSEFAGKIANRIGIEPLFGPKLTQSKLNRIFADPIETASTFANWKNATPGQKAVAWTRLSGATQYFITGLGFLAANQGLNMALGNNKKEDQINFTDPTRSDFLSFKVGGIEGTVPGLHTEIRFLSQILATNFASAKQLHGESRQEHIEKLIGQYQMNKMAPAVQRGVELATGQNWMGRPLPWSSEKGTAKRPKLSWWEYAASIGPIPLQGPIGYVFDQLRKSGASAPDAMTITKALIIGGLGGTGLHVREEPEQKKVSR